MHERELKKTVKRRGSAAAVPGSWREVGELNWKRQVDGAQHLPAMAVGRQLAKSPAKSAGVVGGGWRGAGRRAMK